MSKAQHYELKGRGSAQLYLLSSSSIDITPAMQDNFENIPETFYAHEGI